MMLIAYLIVLLCMAIIPLVMTLWNASLLEKLSPYPDDTPLSASGNSSARISVLIPARNEALRIAGTLQSLQGQGSSLGEVLVLDDHSTDNTSEVVLSFVPSIPNLKVISGTGLPPGWCGKNFACSQLAAAARCDLLVFLDADVQLKPGALNSLAEFMSRHPHVDLASGIPQQTLGSFWEKILIPQIHFILMGFLPLKAMRSTLDPGFAAACGQLMVIRSGAYHATGGHSSIASKIHDGLQLARHFRASGCPTDLFDPTSIARCRMYLNGSEVFHGLSKNATEGMADWKAIFPMTALLVFGQVLPVPTLLLMLAWNADFSIIHWILVAAGALASLLPRFLIARRFELGILPGFLQPLAALILISIQWVARIRAILGRPSTWKGRQYPAS